MRKTAHRLAAALLAVAALARVGAAWGTPAPADAFDAHPQEDDLTLPMPGNARMVFRPVWLGVGDKLLATRDFSLGDREKKNYKETIVPVKLGGAFVADNHGQRDALFYLGKYEVTRAQFASLPSEGESADKKGADTGHDDLPQTDLTTTQVMRFVADYDAWLHTDHLDALPNYEGNVGIVRLPTEVEWEFAARGGVAVVADPGRFDARTPYGSDLGRHEWFAGPRSSLNKLKAVGKLLPNPLGVYDLLGNAAELTCDPYRLEYGQGVQGGLTVRGGSFLTAEDDMRASLRTEQPVYGRDGKPPHNDFIGFRLVITASQVFTDQNRGLVESAAREQKPSPVPPAAAPSASLPPPPLPADAQLVDNEITRRRVAIDNEQNALRIGGGPALAKGSRVRAVRDEKMYFDQTMRRMSQVGEVFPVAFHDVAKKKVFVLVNDSGSPTPVALSMMEDALETVPRDAETIFREALDALQVRDFGHALPLLGQLVQRNPSESVYGAVYSAVGRLAQAMQAQAIVPQQQRTLFDQAALKRHNAKIARQGNGLTGASYGADGEAEQLDSAAEKLEQKAKDLSREADALFKVATEGVHETAQKLDHDGAPDVTLALYRLLLTNAPPDCSERATRADAVYTAAWAANRAGQLYQCRSLVKSGLEIAARHRRLSSLAAVVAVDTALVERAVHTAENLEQQGQAAAAAVLTRHAASLCHDCDELNGMTSRLVSSIAP